MTKICLHGNFGVKRKCNKRGNELEIIFQIYFEIMEEALEEYAQKLEYEKGEAKAIFVCMICRMLNSED